VLIRPSDERMRELISLRAFGLSEIDAVRYYVALKMAERGLVSAPNMAIGQPFNYGLTGVATGLPGLDGGAHAAAAQYQVAQQAAQHAAPQAAARYPAPGTGA
jgi:hypothetical protein